MMFYVWLGIAFLSGIAACLGILRWSVSGPEEKYRNEH